MFPLFLLLISFLCCGCLSFDTGPPVDRRAIAGLWKLTPCPTFPLKEFTVYPLKDTHKNNNQEEELLLMLKEDGSFQQYSGTANKDLDLSWSRLQRSRRPEQEALDRLQYLFLHGTWDFRDGKLLLAADRPDLHKSDDIRRLQKDTMQGMKVEEEEEKTKKKTNKPSDTLLTGRVGAKYQNQMKDQGNQDEGNTKSGDSAPSTSSNSKISLDAYLSVPNGSVKVGRFFYPRNHPSFFDQPMYEPKKRGMVSLRQVLGEFHTADDNEEEMTEKFRNTDFHNKTFLLTSHPIGFRAPPKDKYNNKLKNADEITMRPDNVRVLQIRFHANNTFSTVAGLGENILRGRFSITGNARDQLWMHVSRFGFGRSVSGSVYSEGNSISHEDAKSYWGTIGYYQEGNRRSWNETSATASNQTEIKHLMEVQGSVMYGWGIEPIPEARFIMRELALEETMALEDEEDDDDEEALRLMLEAGRDQATLGGEDGIDLSNSDSFQ